MKSSRQLAIVAILFLQLLPAFADDVITNFMSPIASFQYAEDFNSEALTNGGIGSLYVSYEFQENFASESLTNGGIESPFVSYQYLENFSGAALTNGGILSPIVSYQYLEWPDGILNLQSSPTVSYYYQFLDAPVLNIISTTRTPTTAESTPAYLITPPPPSQLMAYHGGIFTANLASVNPNQSTIVLTHGWIPTLAGNHLFANGGPEGWPTDMAAELRANGITSANIVAWNWTNAATSSVLDPKQAGGQTPQQGIELGQALLSVLGSSYSGQIHFIGHSYGTLVNAYAANYLQGTNFANEIVSPTPWPAANMQMTLFDEAEVGADKDFNLNPQDIQNLEGLASALAGINGNLLNQSSPYYHPLPNQFAWADNYISAFGLPHPQAVNVILTNEFPANAPDPVSWFYALGTFHYYPVQWYEETIQSDGASLMGFRWSFEKGGFAGAPPTNTVYIQTINSSELDLTLTNWNYATSFLNQRFQKFDNGLGNATAQFIDNALFADGSAIGQAIGGINATEWLFSLVTTPANSVMPQFRAHPLGQPEGSGSSANVPAYAWMQLVVPTNAVSMSFDYIIQGDWQSDTLAAAFNGTNVLLIAGNVIQTNVTFSSGSIDVSTFAGQTNEFFVGIVGGTSTNAELTVENLSFSISLPPSLQTQMSGSNLMLSWPMSAQNFNLQTTTNLADTNSWTMVTNVPAIVNLQNAVTNSISDGARFYRLMK